MVNCRVLLLVHDVTQVFEGAPILNLPDFWSVVSYPDVGAIAELRAETDLHE